MGEINYYHVTMVIRKEEEIAIKSMFEDKNWPCCMKVLSEEIVADIIKSGFTDVFPLTDCKQDVTDVIDTESKVNDVGDCENDSNDVVMETKNHIEDSDDKPESEIKERIRKLPTRKSSRRNTSILQHSEEKQNKKANKRRGRCKAKQDEKGNHYILQCIDCKLKFQSREEFWSHRDDLQHQLPAVNIPTKYNLDVYSKDEHKRMGFIKCDGCESYFLGKRRQMKHFYVVHRDLMPTPTCPICCKEFETYAELLKHKREEGHRDSLSSLNNYQCDLCGKHMTSYSNFVQHKQFVCGIGEKEMEKIRIHECDLCGKLFKSPRHVRRHKKISHFKVPEMCDICGTLCQGRKALDVHKKRHDEKNKKHVCNDCGKAFFSDSKLQEHIRTHTKEKPFKCPLCTYTCAVKPNIHKHAMNVHKQAVSAVDLRKTQVNEKNNTTDNSYRVEEPVQHTPETSQILLCLKDAQDNNVSSEICNKVVDSYPTNFEFKTNSNALNVEKQDNHSAGKYQLNIDQTCMSSPVTLTNTVSLIVPHKSNAHIYNGNDVNTDMQIDCGPSEIVYYSGREEKRTDFLIFPHSDIYNDSHY